MGKFKVRMQIAFAAKTNGASRTFLQHTAAVRVLSNTRTNLPASRPIGNTTFLPAQAALYAL